MRNLWKNLSALMPRLLLGIFCGACLHAQIPDFSASNRINNMEKTIQELGLNPMVSSQDDVDKAADMLREKGFDGILLIAPSKIDVDSDGGLPLMGFDAYRTTDRAGIGFDYSAVLVAMRAAVRMAHETSGLKSAWQKALGRSMFGAAALLAFEAVFHAVA